MVRVEKNGRTAPDPEVPEKAQRRRFTAEYKLKILKLADECERSSGEIGELLRKEGLYSSVLANWRRQREDGRSPGLRPRSADASRSARTR